MSAISSPAAHPAAISWAEARALAPDVFAAFSAVSAGVAKSGLDPLLVELVKIRASQMNGCAFCLQMHLAMARAAGESEERMHLVSVWRDAPVFTSRERAALAWTEATCRLTEAGADPAARAAALKVFTPQELVNLAASVALINAYNRIAGPLGFEPQVSTRA